MYGKLIKDEHKKYWPEKYSYTFSIFIRIILNVICNSQMSYSPLRKWIYPKYIYFAVNKEENAVKNEALKEKIPMNALSGLWILDILF